jgi:hypothetical protein
LFAGGYFYHHFLKTMKHVPDQLITLPDKNILPSTSHSQSTRVQAKHYGIYACSVGQNEYSIIINNLYMSDEII